jgi:hypothetical protein
MLHDIIQCHDIIYDIIHNTIHNIIFEKYISLTCYALQQLILPQHSVRMKPTSWRAKGGLSIRFADPILLSAGCHQNLPHGSVRILGRSCRYRPSAGGTWSGLQGSWTPSWRTTWLKAGSQPRGQRAASDIRLHSMGVWALQWNSQGTMLPVQSERPPLQGKEQSGLLCDMISYMISYSYDIIYDIIYIWYHIWYHNIKKYRVLFRFFLTYMISYMILYMILYMIS